MYCIPAVHAFGSVLLTHTLFVQTHIQDVSAPLHKCISVRLVFVVIKAFNFDNFNNSHNSLFEKNISLNFYVNDGSHVCL